MPQHTRQSSAVLRRLLGETCQPAGRSRRLLRLRREKVQITAWEFFKIAVIAMPLALIASLLFLWN